MSGHPVVIVESGGVPVTPVESGAPVFTPSSSGVPVTVTQNATPVVFIGHIPPNPPVPGDS